MAGLDAEGVILRKYCLRETSYILVVFTKEHGKIRGIVKGVRNPYPQFAGDYEIFTLCRLVFYKKKRTFDLITQCEAIDAFLPVRKDIERLTYANYFIELADIVTVDNDVNEPLYEVLLGSLGLLATDCSPKRAARIFELKLLGAVGLSPELSSCARCSSPTEGRCRFSVRSGGLLCPACADKEKDGMAISQGTINFMRKIQESSFGRIAQIKVSKEVGRQTEKVLGMFVQYHINRPVRSLDFLRKVEKVKEKVKVHG
jgi:DNA repair protein RecO (recombination protein O)